MCHMFLAVHWLLAKSRVENLGTVDGSADDARTQFSLQPKLSALDVGLMERLLFLRRILLVRAHSQRFTLRFIGPLLPNELCQTTAHAYSIY